MDKPPVKQSILIKGVNKKFLQGGEVTHALQAVDFSANCGELVMIVGPSGSGKTTLLSVIAGTLRCDSGTISVFDQALDKLTENQITAFRRTHIGFIFQQFHLIPTLTCAENVMIPLLLNGWKAKDAKPKAEKALEEVGLGSKVSTSPKKLSGGQQQRVAIARALIHNPKLIICDEPTSALDAESGSKVMDIIKGHAQSEDRSVIIVTHDSRTYKYADRVVEMEDGKILNSVKNHG